MRRLIMFVAVTAVLAAAALVHVSGASFTSGSTSTLSATTDRIQNWLHLYSQSTDPDGLTGYWTRAPGTSPAATGIDDTLAVNLGILPRGTDTDCMRVFTVKTPSAFPTGSSATVTASLVADPGTGAQPIVAVRFSTPSGGLGSTTSLGVDRKAQFDMRVRPAAAGVTYHPTILITVTYTGMTATYYQYSVPVTVTGQ